MRIGDHHLSPACPAVRSGHSSSRGGISSVREESSQSWRRGFGWATIAFAALFAFQAVRLDADPSFLKRFGDFGDEGYWQHNARCKVLFGQWLPDEFNQAYIGAPLFTLGQWAVFSLAGVSMATARWLPLLATWLLLLVWHAMLRREFSPRWALGIVVALGIAHEMLIYVKWSTPIVPEMCCWTLVAYCIQSGTRGSALWYLPAGLCLAAATAMKISAVYSYPGIALCLAVAVLVRRECPWRGAGCFLAGALAGLSGLVGFFAVNLEQCQRFRDSIGAAALSHRPGIIEAARGILLFPLADFFCYPSVVWIVFLASLWACEWLVHTTRMGVVASLRAMTQLECYCACWLIGSGAVLAVSPDKADRRCIALVLPLSLLAAIFARRQFLAGSSAVGPSMTARGADPCATRDFGSPWGRQPRCIGPRAFIRWGASSPRTSASRWQVASE